MLKLLVVGSNSFSGASFVQYALEKNAKVLGVSRSDEPAGMFLPYFWGQHEHFQFQQMDLNYDLPRLISWMLEEQPTHVINFAAQSMVAQSWARPRDWFMTNTVATIELHDALRKLPFLERYIHISTPEVYGNCAGSVKEDHPFHPSTPYAVSRAAADLSLQSFFSAYQFPYIATRAANVYGPGQQLYRIIPRAILSILKGEKIPLHGGGTSTRSFIHIRDVADATWRLLQSGTIGETYHIATQEILSIRELIEKICKKMDVAFEDVVEITGERLGKDAAYHLNSDKIRNELGWKDLISLDQGLDACIAWAHHHLPQLVNYSMDYVHKA